MDTKQLFAAICQIIGEGLPTVLPEHLRLLRDADRLLVFISVTPLLAVPTAIIERRLKGWQADIADLSDETVEFHISQSSEIDSISRTLFLALEREIPGAFDGVDISSLVGDPISVRVTSPQTALNEAAFLTAELICRRILREVSAREIDVEVIGAKHRATDRMILRAIKIRQPATHVTIESEIIAQGFSVGTEKDLNLQLDRLIKRGLVLFLRIGAETPAFALTVRGIASLPSQFGGRSSDIARALALSRSQR